MGGFGDDDKGNQGDGNHSNDVSDSVSGSDSPLFDFKSTLKLSDTLKLPTISKCLSDTNLRFRKKSVGSGKSILKSKSETQLVSILKESTFRESEEDKYLSGGYSEIVGDDDDEGESTQIKRPVLKYTKSESQNGTYGFDSCRYTSGGESYSYKPGSGLFGDNGDKPKKSGRQTRSKSVGGGSYEELLTTSYTRSLDHFTLSVVDGSQKNEGSRKRSPPSLADTLKFPKEYKYDHFTLKGDKLGEYDDTGSDEPTFTNSVQSDNGDTESDGISRSNSFGSTSSSTSSSRSDSSSSSEELIWSPRPRQSNVRAEPLPPKQTTTPSPRTTPPPRPSSRPAGDSRTAQSSSTSYASRSTGPRPSALSRSLTGATSRQSSAGVSKPQHSLSSQACFDGLKTVTTVKKPIRSPPSNLNSAYIDSSELEDHFNNPLTPQYTPKRPESHVTKPHKHSGPCYVPSPDPPQDNLLASVAHIVPLVAAQSQLDQRQVLPPTSRDQTPLIQYQNSKSRAVANLRSRQLLQARGIRVLPRSPLGLFSHVRSDYESNEEESVISRDSLTHSPDLSIVPQTVLTQQARRPSLFRSYSGQKLSTIMESRDAVFKTPTESSLFKSRDLFEKLKFRKPTTFTLAKSLVDEILLFPARYLLIKKEKLRKYALLHSAVTNCYIFNTGWSRDEKTRFFSKAEGPFILKSNRRR